MTTPAMHLDCDGFAEALADHLEGDAPEGVRIAVEGHAGQCAPCGQLLADLRSLSASAAALPALVPSRDLWSGIAERIDTRVIPMDAPRVGALSGRTSWLRPALAAAALVAITAGVTHYLTRASLSPVANASRQVAVLPTVEAAAEPTAEIVSTASEQPAPLPPHPATRGSAMPAARLVSTAPAISEAEPVFASEISSLRKIVKHRRDQLDPKTVAILEQSIAVMDSAIAQSRAALLKDPASGFLATQLNHSLEKKVELLRTAALLPART